MNRKTVVYVLALSLIFSGCVSTYSHQEVQNQDIRNQEWISNTINMLEKSRGIDGGYSDFSPQISDLYSTYYYLSSLEILGKEPKYKEETVRWLLSKEQEILNGHSPKLDDIYFVTMSLEILGAQPKNKSEIKAEIMNLQTSDGSFSGVKEDEGSLLDTFRALQILNTIGSDLNETPTTKKWLLERWNRIDENEELVYLTSDTSLLIPALKLYNVNVLLSGKFDQENNWLIEQRTAVETEILSIPEQEIDLITLHSLTEFLLITGDLNPNVKTKLVTYIMSKQLSDGGYNVFYEKYGESQGTYLALLIASKIGFELNNNVLEFVCDHEIRDGSGGFRPSYRLLSSTENTYFAVNSLKILGVEPLNKNDLYSYLETQLSSDDVDYKDLYYIIATYGLLGQIPPHITEFHDSFSQKITEISKKPSESITEEDLINVMYITKAENELGTNLNDKELLIRKVQSFQNDDGSFGFGSSDIFLTYYMVSILKELGTSPLDKESCVHWIKEGQVEDGGFIARRGDIFTNSSDIYSTYISTSSLKALEEKPDDSNKLSRWLEDCMIETGGFGFTTEYAELNITMSASESTLETTAWGLMIWDYLSNLDNA